MGSSSRLGIVLAAVLVAGPASAEPGSGVTLRFALPDGMQGKRLEKRQGRAQGEVARRSALRVERMQARGGGKVGRRQTGGAGAGEVVRDKPGDV